ncbi:MAG: class I SAM-dependent methyltransferase [Gemmataceae bacterium]|nr:class I SAM-dependent methyltransferase [Gemmataceae bacterium]
MAEAQPTSYDEVPYACNVFYYSHPDRLATMARLLGVQSAPVANCRVLELGCGDGANLIPMAYALPESRFLGIDLSPRQVEMGQESVQQLGLTNIDLRHLSILDVDSSFGRFDYIICHGVYSWVPAEVQRKILSICKEHLAPGGVAYVSYNTYPGWHRRNMIREMMRYHVRQFADPKERVQQARAILDFLIECIGDPKSAYGVILQAEADMLTGVADSYIYHEHLEENNHPIYFHEFAGRLAEHGLQYLAEAQPTPLARNLSPRAAQTLQQVSVNLIQAEQYLDFVRNRTFRRSLVCHADTPVSRPPAHAAITGMCITTLLRPESDTLELPADAPATYRTQEDATLSTNNPLLKAALWRLWQSWPQAVSFADLWEAVRGMVSAEVASTANTEPLTEPLLQCYLASMVELHMQPARFVLTVGKCPQAGGLARLSARRGIEVPNLRHRTVVLNEFERQILSLLDGRHDQSAILEALLGALSRGDLEIHQDGEKVRDLEKGRTMIEPALPPTLQKMARLALLEG